MATITSLGLFGVPFGARTFAAKTAAVVKRGGAIKKRVKQQWYELPNGVRILATPERYQSLIRNFEERQKRVAEPEEIAPTETVVVETVVVVPDGLAPPPAEAVIFEGPLLGQLAPVPVPEKTIAPADPALLRATRAVEAMHEAARQEARRAQQAEAERLHLVSLADAARRQWETEVERHRMNAEEDELILKLLIPDLAA